MPKTLYYSNASLRNVLNGVLNDEPTHHDTGLNYLESVVDSGVSELWYNGTKLEHGGLSGTYWQKQDSNIEPILDYHVGISNISPVDHFTVGTLPVLTANIAQANVTVTSNLITNNVIVGTGGLSTPTIRFNGDETTGIYQTSAGQLGITTGGTLSAEFTSQGITLPESGKDITIGRSNVLFQNDILIPSHIVDASVCIGSDFDNQGFSGIGNDSISIGTLNTGRLKETDTGSISIGKLAASPDVTYTAGGKQGEAAIAIGSSAGKNPQERDAIAIGTSAARGMPLGAGLQKERAIAIGYHAGRGLDDPTGSVCQSACAIAIGSEAGLDTQGSNAIAIGYQAGQLSQGSNAIAIGNLAGVDPLSVYGQSANTIVINASGQPFGGGALGIDRFYVKPIRYDGTTSNVLTWDNGTGEITSSNISLDSSGILNLSNISGHGSSPITVDGGGGLYILSSSGLTVKGSNGITTTEFELSGKITYPANPIAIECDAAALNIDIGYQPGSASSVNTVNLGQSCGQQPSTGSVNIGLACGFTGAAQGSNCVAIGNRAGRSNQSNGDGVGNCVAIGCYSGSADQAGGAVAIGHLTAHARQGAYAIAIGGFAGATDQGANSVCIGRSAGYATCHANCIMLNASGAATASTQADSFFVNPIRIGNPDTSSNVLTWDHSSGEIISSNLSLDSSGVLTLGDIITSGEVSTKRLKITDPASYGTHENPIDLSNPSLGLFAMVGGISRGMFWVYDETSNILEFRVITDIQWPLYNCTPIVSVQTEVNSTTSLVSYRINGDDTEDDILYFTLVMSGTSVLEDGPVRVNVIILAD